MTIRKVSGHKNLFWRNGIIYIRYKVNKRTHWISTKKKTIAQAIRTRIYRDFLSMSREEFILKRQEEVRRDERLIEIIGKKYLVHCKRMGRRDMEARTGCINRLVLDFKGKPVEEFNRDHMERFRDKLINSLILGERNKSGKLMSPSTVNRYLEYASSFFTFCRKARLIKVNPCDDVDQLRVTSKKERFVDNEEEAKLLDAAEPWFQPWIIFAIEMGCRKGEMVKLEWSDINLRRGRHGYVTFRDSKNDTTTAIPMSERAAKALKMIPRRPDHSHPFSGPDGNTFKNDSERGYDDWPLQKALRVCHQDIGACEASFSRF